MFHAIRTDDIKRLTELGHKFHSQHRNLAACVLCFDHLFSKFTQSQYFDSMPASTFASTLEDFLLYAQTLQAFAVGQGMHANKHLQKLLAFSENDLSPMSYFVHIRSPLHAQAKLGRHMNASDRGLEVLRQRLQSLCSDFLDAHLRDRVRAMSIACKTLPMEPCLHFVIRGWCGIERCPKSHAYIDDVQAYNIRVRIHLLKVQIYHTIWGLESHARRRPLHRCVLSSTCIIGQVAMTILSIYLSQLYDAINPFHYRLGSPSNLIQIDISIKARRIVLQWICESFFALKIDPTPHKYFFTVVFQLFYLYRWAKEDVAVPDYLRRVPWVISQQGPEWLMRERNQLYVVPDILDCVGMHKQVALSKSILLLR